LSSLASNPVEAILVCSLKRLIVNQSYCLAVSTQEVIKGRNIDFVSAL
jgi:hypothetical protein